MKLNKKQLIIGGVTLALVLGGGIAVTSHQVSKAQTRDRQEKLVNDTAAVEKIQKQIKAGYLNDKSSFIKKSVTSKTVSELQKSLNQYSKTNDVALKKLVKTTQGQLGKFKATFEAITSVNDLFEKSVITEDKLTKDVAIKAATTAKTAEAIKVAGLDETVTKTLTEAKLEATNQAKTLDTAKTLVSSLFKDGKALDSEDGYNKAKAEVAKVKNQTEKKALEDKLAQVKTVVDDANKKEADEKKKQEEDKQAAEKQAAEKAAAETGGSAVQDSNGSWSVQQPTDNSAVPGQNNGGGSTGGGNGAAAPSPTPTPQAPAPTPQPGAPTIVAGAVGNSGMLFDSIEEAIAWAKTQQYDENNPNYMKNRQVVDVVYSDGSRKWTVNFF
ncbi:hypothetical protein RyT2_25310 [Pseudolactococcus yaeyamensis]